MHRPTAIDVKRLTIRSYRLDYRSGQFAKSLFTRVTQCGEDATEYNAHELDYFDDVGTLTADTLNGFRASDAVSAGAATQGPGLVSGRNRRQRMTYPNGELLT